MCVDLVINLFGGVLIWFMCLDVCVFACLFVNLFGCLFARVYI